MKLELEALIDAASTVAAYGASEYLLRNNLSAQPEALASCLKAWIKVKLPEALRDAKEAIDCNMTQAVEATFAASMIQAGIEAAKEASVPPVPAGRYDPATKSYPRGRWS